VAGGTRLLFQRLTPGSAFDLWTMAADGSGQQRLTSMPRNEVGAYVSPDGATVAFQSNNGASVDVWTVPTDGGAPRSTSLQERVSKGRKPARSPSTAT
jgi:Tol biopolymer transport system component